MAVVWVARVVGKLGLEKLYAVKAILPSAPTTTTDVAAFLQEHMSARRETQRREIADAVRAADERAGGAYRPRLASLPELVPMSDAAGAPAPADAPASESASPSRAAALEASHWIAMIAAVLVTVAVWSAVVIVLAGGVGQTR